jgi:hypothetical protein
VHFLDRLFKVEAFKKLYLAKLDEFDKTIFQPQRFHQQVDAIAAAIRPAVSEESPEMLARFDKVVAGEAVEPTARMGGFGRGGMGAKPIKGFADGRTKSVIDQVAGKSQGMVLEGGGFGGRGGGGGMRGGGGDRAFGPGQMLAMSFMAAMDVNKDGQLARDEFTSGFEKWFLAWNTDNSGILTDEQLRAGIDKDITPSRGGPVPAPGGGGGIGGSLRDLFRGSRRAR